MKFAAALAVGLTISIRQKSLDSLLLIIGAGTIKYTLFCGSFISVKYHCWVVIFILFEPEATFIVYVLLIKKVFRFTF